MEDDNTSDLGLDQDDKDNLKLVMDDLIDIVVKFNSLDSLTEADFALLMTTLDFSKFIVSGIVYANGLDLCADHEHDDGDEEPEGVA